MMDRHFIMTNVFAEKKFSGNRLVTVFLRNDEDDEDLKRTAREFGGVETAFVFLNRSSGGPFKIRVFCGRREIPFSGHSIIGSAWAVWNHIINRSGNCVEFESSGRTFTVRADHEKNLFCLSLQDPVAGPVIPSSEIAGILQIPPHMISSILPVQKISMAMDFIIVPASGLMAVRSAEINKSMFESYFKDREKVPLYLYCTETYREENSIHSRVFAHHLGIAEDAGSGSGAAALGAYLRKHTWPAGDISIAIEQGHEIRRESVIHLEIKKSGGKDLFHVCGRVFPVSEGSLI